MKEELLYILRQNFPEERISRLGEIFVRAETAPEDVLPRLEQALADLLEEQRKENRFFLKSAPSGKIHLLYLSGGLYLVTVRGFRKILWDALLEEGDMCVSNVSWVEQSHLLLFSLENIVHRKKSSCICSYAPGDAFLIRRPWRPLPGEDGCIQ